MATNQGIPQAIALTMHLRHPNTGIYIPVHTNTTGVNMAKLQYGVIKAASEASGYHRVYVSRIVNGHSPWRKCSTLLLRALSQNGWEPPEGKEFVTKWIKMMSVPIAVASPTPEPQVIDTQPVEVAA